MSIQSVERAFSVLTALSRRRAALTTVARDIDLPVSTVSRLLTTLEDLGAVVRDDDAQWSIGPAIHALGASDPDASIIVRVRSQLEALVALTGETAGVSVRDGRFVHYLDHVDSAHDVQIRDWTGERLPLHVASSGQVLLAYADDLVVADVLAAALETVASRTITDPAKLRQRLETIRRDGFAVTDREFSDDIASVAAPVFGPVGVVAAIHVHSPAYRFPSGEARTELIEAVTAAAASVSARSITAGSLSRQEPSSRSNP